MLERGNDVGKAISARGQRASMAWLRDGDETEIGFFGLVASGREAPPVLALVEDRLFWLRHSYLALSCEAGSGRLFVTGMTASMSVSARLCPSRSLAHAHLHRRAMA